VINSGQVLIFRTILIVCYDILFLVTSRLINNHKNIQHYAIDLCNLMYYNIINLKVKQIKIYQMGKKNNESK